MKHVIVGGSGFTGHHLADELVRRGEQIVVADIVRDETLNDSPIGFHFVDLRSKESLQELKLDGDDIVHHLAANQYHGDVPNRGRQAFFDDVNVNGTRNLLEHMENQGCGNLVYFSTDMVYGIPQTLPVTTDHELSPIGPYGESKRRSEAICQGYRNRGFRVAIFRPRLIVGPGRLGVLEKLFALIKRGLPVPLIGNGSNHYQMVSVHDCVSADLLAIDSGIPNDVYNLGSKEPPTVRTLLGQLVNKAQSRSRLLSTPGMAVKAVLGLMDNCGLTLLHKEQYAIADLNYLVDISKTEKELSWRPKYRDEDMLFQAFDEFVKQAK